MVFLLFFFCFLENLPFQSHRGRPALLSSAQNSKGRVSSPSIDTARRCTGWGRLYSAQRRSGRNIITDIRLNWPSSAQQCNDENIITDTRLNSPSSAQHCTDGNIINDTRLTRGGPPLL